MNTASWHIPDPTYQPEFYESVPTKRAIAWGIDSLIVTIITVLILPLTAFAGVFFFYFLWLAVNFAYRVLTIAGGSATIGMRLMGIELRTQNGARFSLSDAMLHTIGLSISFSIFPLQIISALMMLISVRGQGLSDHLLGSVMINRRSVRRTAR